MPSHRYHRALDRLILGEPMEHVHLVKDAPYKLFPGKKHRNYFHDLASDFWIGAVLGPRAFVSAYLHDWLDENFIEDKETGKLIPRSKRRKARRTKRR